MGKHSHQADWVDQLLATWDYEVFSAHNKAKGHSYPNDDAEFISLDEGNTTSQIEKDLEMLSLERQQNQLASNATAAAPSESTLETPQPRRAAPELLSIDESGEDSDDSDIYYNPPASLTPADNHLPPAGPAITPAPRPIANPTADPATTSDNSANASTSEQDSDLDANPTITVAAVAAPSARRASTRKAVTSKSGNVSS